MSFKDISNLELWRLCCSAERNPLCNFGRGQHEEQLFEISQDFLSRALAAIFAISVEGIKGVHTCEIILNLDQWFMRCHLKKKFTHHGRRPITIAHLEPFARVS